MPFTKFKKAKNLVYNSYLKAMVLNLFDEIHGPLSEGIWAQTFALNLRKFITLKAKQVTQIKNLIFG